MLSPSVVPAPRFHEKALPSLCFPVHRCETLSKKQRKKLHHWQKWSCLGWKSPYEEFFWIPFFNLDPSDGKTTCYVSFKKAPRWTNKPHDVVVFCHTSKAGKGSATSTPSTPQKNQGPGCLFTSSTQSSSIHFSFPFSCCWSYQKHDWQMLETLTNRLILHTQTQCHIPAMRVQDKRKSPFGIRRSKRMDSVPFPESLWRFFCYIIDIMQIWSLCVHPSSWQLLWETIRNMTMARHGSSWLICVHSVDEDLNGLVINKEVRQLMHKEYFPLQKIDDCWLLFEELSRLKTLIESCLFHIHDGQKNLRQFPSSPATTPTNLESTFRKNSTISHRSASFIKSHPRVQGNQPQGQPTWPPRSSRGRCYGSQRGAVSLGKKTTAKSTCFRSKARWPKRANSGFPSKIPSPWRCEKNEFLKRPQDTWIVVKDKFDSWILADI